MTISVLITTRNRAKILNQCLKSLVQQSRKPDEIVVVDNLLGIIREIVESFKKFQVRYFSRRILVLLMEEIED